MLVQVMLHEASVHCQCILVWSCCCLNCANGVYAVFSLWCLGSHAAISSNLSNHGNANSLKASVILWKYSLGENFLFHYCFFKMTRNSGPFSASVEWQSTVGNIGMDVCVKCVCRGGWTHTKNSTAQSADDLENILPVVTAIINAVEVDYVLDAGGVKCVCRWGHSCSTVKTRLQVLPTKYNLTLLYPENHHPHCLLHSDSYQTLVISCTYCEWL